MVNWKENNYPFKKFTEKLTQEWINCGFTKKETREWLESGLQPSDASFTQWLKNIEKKDAEWFSDYSQEDKLRKEYQEYSLKEIFGDESEELSDALEDFSDLNEEINIWSWKNINIEFTLELQQKWEEKGIGYEECKEWIDVGLKISDSDYVQWLKVIKNFDAKLVLSYSNDEKLRKEYKEFLEKVKSGSKLGVESIKIIKDFKKYDLTPEQKLLIGKLMSNELKERYTWYGLCKECYQPNTGADEAYDGWCQSCNSQHFQKDFGKWTSNNEEVDEIIMNCQLEANNVHGTLEWIPYEQFINIEYLAEGGFSKVYRAQWTDGPIESWDIEDKKWKKYAFTEVVLKNLNNSSDINTSFLQEIANHKLISNNFYRNSLKYYGGDLSGDKITKCYGISQDPITKNYVMVMEYIEDGNLRQYVKNNHKKLTSPNYKKLNSEDKLGKLFSIAQGLEWIHHGGLVHRDLHSGNILNKICNNRGDTMGNITDLGLCRPANEKDDKKIFGVLPYIAPEVLRGGFYTQASDVYSFGMIAYELFFASPPYHELQIKDTIDDLNLALLICKGLRPKFDFKIPPLIEALIENCWDADLSVRPTAHQLVDILGQWYYDVYEEKNVEIVRQFKETTILNKKLLSEQKKNFISRCWPQAIYTSRLLDFKNLPKPQNSREINKIFYKLSEEMEDLRITDPVKLSEELEKRFGNLQIHNKSQEALIAESEEIPPIKIPNQTSNWTTLHPNLTEEQTRLWQNSNFTPSQTQDWLSIGLQPTDHQFATYLRDQKHLTPETALNQANYEQLKQEFLVYQQFQVQQEQPPKH